MFRVGYRIIFLSNIWYSLGVFVLVGILFMFRLGFLTAYLDESTIIEQYADQYVSSMQNMGIDASVLECVAVQDERFWVRLRVQCDGAKPVTFLIGLWGQLIIDKRQFFIKKT
jgi:hypothetical protein